MSHDDKKDYQDFIDATAYAPGEFERELGLFENSVSALAEELVMPVTEGFRRTTTAFWNWQNPGKKAVAAVVSACTELSSTALTKWFTQLPRCEHKDQPVALNGHMLGGTDKMDNVLGGMDCAPCFTTADEVVAGVHRYQNSLETKFYKDFQPIEFGTQLLVVPTKNSLKQAFTLCASRETAEVYAQAEKTAFLAKPPGV